MDSQHNTKHIIFEDTEKEKRASELWVTVTKNQDQTKLDFVVDVKWRALAGPLPPNLIFAASRNHSNEQLRHKSFKFKNQFPKRLPDNKMEGRVVKCSRYENTHKEVSGEAHLKRDAGGVIGAKFAKDEGKGEETTLDSIELKADVLHDDCLYWMFSFNDQTRNEKDPQVLLEGFSFSLESETPLNNPRMWFFVGFEKDKKKTLGALTNVHRYTLICKDTVEEQEDTVEFPLAYRINSRANLGIALEERSPPVTRRVKSWIPINSGSKISTGDHISGPKPEEANQNKGEGEKLEEEEDKGEGEKLEKREENKEENE
mmetsp:Transcript_2636/g.4060  ORF Transcript_2636/g.4060 Transcript_2636/m.4060 type:complete len:316 (-) Transcript_2636:150-1097(-)